MAALSATSGYTESVGSMTLKFVNVTSQGTSDTYTMYAGAPIIAVAASSANPGTGVSFVASTGVITIINSSGTANTTLIIWMRGA